MPLWQNRSLCETIRLENVLPLQDHFMELKLIFMWLYFVRFCSRAHLTKKGSRHKVTLEKGLFFSSVRVSCQMFTYLYSALHNWIKYELKFSLNGLFCVCLHKQVVDTPGILDHSLEERNTIEMQVRIYIYKPGVLTFSTITFSYKHACWSLPRSKLLQNNCNLYAKVSLNFIYVHEHKWGRMESIVEVNE